MRSVGTASRSCKPGVIPLDEPPMLGRATKVHPRIELGPPLYKGRMPPAHSRTIAHRSIEPVVPGGNQTPVSSL